MNTIVTFSAVGAQIKRSFHTIHKSSIINPDISHLKDVPQIFWKLENGRVIEMTRPEKIQRLRQLKKHVVEQTVIKHKNKKRVVLLLSVAIVILATIIRRMNG